MGKTPASSRSTIILLGTMVPYDDDDDGGIQSAGAGGYEY